MLLDSCNDPTMRAAAARRPPPPLDVDLDAFIALDGDADPRALRRRALAERCLVRLELLDLRHLEEDEDRPTSEAT